MQLNERGQLFACQCRDNNTALLCHSYRAVFFESPEESAGKQGCRRKGIKKRAGESSEIAEISLTEPLSEKTRPTKFEDIIGQEEGIKALKAALCGPTPNM